MAEIIIFFFLYSSFSYYVSRVFLIILFSCSGVKFQNDLIVFSNQLALLSWNYSNIKNNLNGKINLPYSIIWGAITYLWIKYDLDIYLKFYNKILKFKLSQIIIIIISIFLAFGLSLTSIITKRYSQKKRH